MKHTKLISIASSLFAITFAQADNVSFPVGTTSAAALSASISAANTLYSNASGRFLVFDDSNSYTIGAINLRNTNFTGDDSTIYVDSGTLNVVGRIDLGGSSATRGTLYVRGGTVSTSTLSIGNGVATNTLSGSTGSFNMTSGNVTVSTILQMSRGPGAQSTLDLSGGTMTIAGLSMNSGTSASSTITGSATSVITVSGTGKLYGTATWNIGNLASNEYGTASATVVVKDGGYVDNNTNNVYTQVGTATNSTATISVQNGGTAVFRKMTLGDAAVPGATGVLELTGNGSVTTTFISAGNRSGSTGIITIADTSTLNLGTGGTNLASGSYSSAAMTVSGGTYTGAYLSLGLGTSSQAITTVSGGAVSLSGTLLVGAGDQATGRFNLQSGTVSAGNINVGSGYVATDTQSAQSATGTFSMTGGTLTASNGLTVAPMVSGAHTTGTYEQSGGTAWSKLVYVGANNNDAMWNTAVFNLSGGTFTSNTFFNIGSSSNNGTASATATISGTGKLTVDTLAVMRAGTLSAANIILGSGFTPGNGEVLASTSMLIYAGATVNTGTITGSNGTLGIRGGSVSATNLNLGLNGQSSLFTMSGGVVSISTALNLASQTVNAAGSVTYTQSGGTFWAQAASIGTKTAVGATTSVNMTITGGVMTIGNYFTIGANTTSGNVDAYVTVGANGVLEAGRYNINGGGVIDVYGTLRTITPVSGSNHLALNAAGANEVARLIIRNGATVQTTANINLQAYSELTMEVGDSFKTVSVGGALTFGTGTGITGTQKLILDFATLDIATSQDITLVSGVSAITGFSEWYATADTNLVIQNLDSSKYVFNGLSLDGTGTSLLASISVVPEPAVAAALLGLLALATVIRRRR